MSYPILYSATETKFDHNGIGILSACVSCEVTEEANGIFELAMQYPMDGIHFAKIGGRAIIKAKADQFRDPQLFRVYAISKPMNGIVTVLAEHISYDLSGIPVKPFSASTASSALVGLKNNAVVGCPFDFWTDKTTQANFMVSAPASIRSRLGGVAGSILDVYGGEYEFDNYTVKLHNSRGTNRGVSIRYGKNLTDIQQDQNCSNVATGVYPYWVSQEDGTLVELPEKIVSAPGTYNFVKIRTVDFSMEFETKPTEEQLRSRTVSYIKANNIGVPVVSWSVSFEQLSKSEEYKHLALLERVSLFDAVNVEFPALGVSATARAVKLVYDVIADRVKSVTLGSVRANIADTIANQGVELEKAKEKPSVSMVQKISSALTKAIMGASGGAVRLIDTNDDGEPDELYIADNADPTQAVKVWRFNYNGWAASKNGYAGPFEMGATLEDGLLSNFVTAANLIAGTIKSQDGQTFVLDLDNGILRMRANELSISGKTVDEIAKTAADAAEKAAKDAASSALNDYAETVAKDFEELQAQIDGNITSWFGDVVPTTSNEPAVNWTTEELKNQHLGDLYYINEGAEQGGTAYRWALVSGVYKWVIVEDTDVAKALAAAAKAQDTADSKRRVFVAQPTPPYDVGDLWTQGGSGDIMRCNTSRGEGAAYVASDWELASKYIDSATAGSIAKGKVDAQTQTDIFNKLTNNGTIEGLYMKDGKLYINASYIMSGVLDAALITVKNLIADSIHVKNGSDETLFHAGDGFVQLSGWSVAPQKLTNGTIDTDGFVGIYSSFGSGDGDYDEYGDYVGPGNGSAAIQGGHYSDAWRLLIGRYFGVDKYGSLYCSNANISGYINSNEGYIAGWDIESDGFYKRTNSGAVHLTPSELGAAGAGDACEYVRWMDVYNSTNAWLIDPYANESDANVKNSISDIDNYDILFDRLKPCRYKYKHGTSGRYHTGFIAQEVVEAIESSGLTTQDFAGVVHLEKPNENGCEWLLRRDEFIALNTWQIQKLKERVATLEALVAQKS